MSVRIDSVRITRVIEVSSDASSPFADGFTVSVHLFGSISVLKALAGIDGLLQR